MSFGQIVLGPPGSGKTSYCHFMSEFLTGLGRNPYIINLDPANDKLPYKPAIDISDLITLEDVMDIHGLGPNGGLLFCIEFLEKNIEWLLKKIKTLKDPYLLFDCPGQAELYTHHDSMKNIVDILQRKGNHRLVCVHLVDSYYCSSPFTYISAVTLSLSTMIQIELPHVNVFSKMDLIEKYGKLDFNLEFYTNATDLSHIVDIMDEDEKYQKFNKLTKALIQLIEDFNLVSFIPVNIRDKDTMKNLIKIIDRANGYLFTTPDYSGRPLTDIVLKSDEGTEFFGINSVKERYLGKVTDYDEMEEEEEEEK